jgi:uncharacterized protein YoxC
MQSFIVGYYIFFAIIAVAALVLLVSFILSIVNAVKLKKISRHCKSGNLAETIETYYDNVEALSGTISSFSKKFEEYEKDNKHAIQKIAVVRFNAFDDISGDLSFSLAALNCHNDGIIITSIYGHDSSTAFLREITNGKATIHLMDEEEKALRQAMEAY